MVGETMGVGLLGAVELVADKETGEAFDPQGKTGPELVATAQRNGLIIRSLGDRIAFSPPLTILDSEIDTLFSRFSNALEETAEKAAFAGLTTN